MQVLYMFTEMRTEISLHVYTFTEKKIIIRLTIILTANFCVANIRLYANTVFVPFEEITGKTVIFVGFSQRSLFCMQMELEPRHIST